MNIGQFKYDKKTDTYKGNIELLTTLGVDIVFSPNKKASDKEPDYRVTFAHVDDHIIETGAAWKRRSEKGLAFLSVSIDDPVWSAPLNAALFPSDDGKTATLVWNRSKKGKADKADAA